MGFSQATITAVNPPVYSGAQVFISWLTTSPSGTWFQIYLNESLAWWGTSTRATLMIPNDTVDRIDIGTVLPGEQQTNFASSLPPAPERRVQLQWLGGTFESSTIAGFKVYGSDAPGGWGAGHWGAGPWSEIDLTNVLANITAYPQGLPMDGWGMGGWGEGAWGSAASTYTYTTAALWSGNWSFVIIPYDEAGNNGTPAYIGATVAVPPREPALFTDNKRLHYQWSSPWGAGPYGMGPYGGSDSVTLTWNASPG